MSAVLIQIFLAHKILLTNCSGPQSCGTWICCCHVGVHDERRGPLLIALEMFYIIFIICSLVIVLPSCLVGSFTYQNAVQLIKTPFKVKRYKQ